jgi:hypothetical protein
MFHMVGYTRIDSRIEFTQTSRRSELQVAKVKFKP